MELLFKLKDALCAQYPSAQVHVLQLDVRDAQQVEDVLQALPPAFATIDILINNAGAHAYAARTQLHNDPRAVSGHGCGPGHATGQHCHGAGHQRQGIAVRHTGGATKHGSGASARWAHHQHWQHCRYATRRRCSCDTVRVQACKRTRVAACTAPASMPCTPFQRPFASSSSVLRTGFLK